MQRVTNCILIKNGKILLLKKPRRGWYAFPGGKMEQGESIKEAAIREFREETALNIIEPKLAGAFTFTVYDNNLFKQEWMMFTFVANEYDGTLTDYCEEGELEWIASQDIDKLPMAAGDRKILKHVLSSREILYGSFAYTEDYQTLIDYRFDPSITENSTHY